MITHVLSRYVAEFLEILLTWQKANLAKEAHSISEWALKKIKSNDTMEMASDNPYIKNETERKESLMLLMITWGPLLSLIFILYFQFVAKDKTFRVACIMGNWSHGDNLWAFGVTLEADDLLHIFCLKKETCQDWLPCCNWYHPTGTLMGFNLGEVSQK